MFSHYRGLQCGSGWGMVGGESLRKMNGLQPSHEIRKLSITLPVHVVDALRLKLKGDETITDCIKRLVTREALGGAGPSVLN